MTELPSVYGLTGPAQHGKDTIADFLVQEHGFTRFAFADKLKAFVLAQNPYIEYEGYSPPIRLQDTVAYMGWEDAKKVPEVGRLLQVTGTEAAREVLGEDVWVNAVKADAMRALAAGGSVVFSDVSFQNERDLVDLLGGTMIRVLRTNPDGTPFDNGRDPTHISEYNRREGLKVDQTIHNDGSLAEFQSTIKWLFVPEATKRRFTTRS